MGHDPSAVAGRCDRRLENGRVAHQKGAPWFLENWAVTRPIIAGQSTFLLLQAGRVEFNRENPRLEQYSVIGGSSHVFRRQGKWEFDVGVHYIGDCSAGGNVPTILEGIGVADRIEWLPLERHGFDTIIAPDFELMIPHGWNEYLHNLIRAFPSEEKQLRRYVGIMRSLAEGIDRSETPASTTGMLKSAAKWGPAGAWAMVPHDRLMAWCGLLPRTQLVLSLEDAAMATTAQHAPSALIAGFLGNYVGKGAWPGPFPAVALGIAANGTRPMRRPAFGQNT
ncbi:hypothetical protein [Gordonia sihwensis]|uniref:hypothetical protein n=1 Tax=Gordonia sihwensis TaxID=173559 RepID=UPI003D98A19E